MSQSVLKVLKTARSPLSNCSQTLRFAGKFFALATTPSVMYWGVVPAQARNWVQSGGVMSTHSVEDRDEDRTEESTVAGRPSLPPLSLRHLHSVL